jgi:hypothetical protein
VRYLCLRLVHDVVDPEPWRVDTRVSFFEGLGAVLIMPAIVALVASNFGPSGNAVPTFRMPVTCSFALSRGRPVQSMGRMTPDLSGQQGFLPNPVISTTAIGYFVTVAASMHMFGT